MSDIQNRETRIASLNAILPRAEEALRESGGETIVVIRSPIYLDEFAEGEHVYCPQIDAHLLYPHRTWMSDDDYAVDAVITLHGTLYSLEVVDRG